MQIIFYFLYKYRIYIIFIIVLFITTYGIFPVRTIIPVYSLSKEDMNSRVGFPLEGSSQLRRMSLAMIAIDALGRFHILTKRESSSSPHGLINIITVDKNGLNESIAPLYRVDGRAIGYYCDFFTVSPSGKYRWTARTAFEDGHQAILTVYNDNTIALQEWYLPGGDSMIGNIQSFTEKQVDLFATNGDKYRFTIGQPKPILLYKNINTPQYLSSNGKAYSIRPLSAHEKCIDFGVFSSTPSNNDHLIARIDNISISQHLLPFWYDSTNGLFLSMEQSSNYHHKTLYCISATGSLKRLFSTNEFISNKDVRIGQMLKADRHQSVWFPIEYINEKKFMIVKTVYQPRWKTWWHYLSIQSKL